MGDIRLDRVNARLYDRVVDTGSLVVKTIGGTRKDEVAANRFLGNDAVDPTMILAPHIARTRTAAIGRSVLVVQDTTEINFAGRHARRTGLGPAGDGVSPGFFVHAQVAVDAEHGAVLGLVGAEIWTRAQGRVGDRKTRLAGDKESRRWLTGAEVAARELGQAARTIVVGDRESDIYALFAQKPAGVELLVRAAQDRALTDGTSLKAAAEGWPALDRTAVDVPARRVGAAGGPRPARRANLETRAGTIIVQRPKRAGVGTWPASVTLNLVVVTELDPPAAETPITWRLLTTLPVATSADALEVVRLYRLRWRIEEVFRALKKDGLDLEATQVATAKRLLNLAALGIAAAVRTVQLVDARDGSPRPATDVIDSADIPAIAAISRTLEGATARQQNPHAQGCLAWVAWVAARLGGWNCYYRPPGPKTMAAGWDRLASQLQGFDLARRLGTV